MKVIDLLPGDEDKVTKAIFVIQGSHPIFPTFQLVVWYMPDDTWSFDALKPGQVIGEVTSSDETSRTLRLRRALLSTGR